MVKGTALHNHHAQGHMNISFCNISANPIPVMQGLKYFGAPATACYMQLWDLSLIVIWATVAPSHMACHPYVVQESIIVKVRRIHRASRYSWEPSNK